MRVREQQPSAAARSSVWTRRSYGKPIVTDTGSVRR
jgi:hypothetical protein